MPALPSERPCPPPVPGRVRRPGRRTVSDPSPRGTAGDPSPLPDPAAVRSYRIPDPAPPYDNETAASPPPAMACPLSPVAQVGQATQPHPARPGRVVVRAGPGGATVPAGPGGMPVPAGPGGMPVPAGPGGMPVPAGAPVWPSYFAQVLAETLAGVRPVTQLVPWTTERARNRIQQLGPRLAAGLRPRVRRVVTFQPATDAMEMTVVVGFGPRVHALALRLERGDNPGRWLCTTVEAA